MSEPTFPVSPLLAALTLAGWEGRASQAEAAAIHPRHFDRIVDKGVMSLDLADRAACSIGSHPMSIWPDEWQTYLDRALDQQSLFDID